MFILREFLASSQQLQRQYVRRNWRGGLSVADIRQCGAHSQSQTGQCGVCGGGNGSGLHFGLVLPVSEIQHRSVVFRLSVTKCLRHLSRKWQCCS